MHTGVTVSFQWAMDFLEQYEGFRCLWDVSLSEYKNRDKMVAFSEIAEIIAKYIPRFDESVIKAKIRSIRNAYALELNKVQKFKKTGTSPGKIYKPIVPWFSTADQFLRKVVHTRKAQSNMSTIDTPDFAEESENDDNEVEHVVESDAAGTVSIDGPNKIVETTSSSRIERHASRPFIPPKRLRKSAKSEQLESIICAVSALREISHQSAFLSNRTLSEDEFGIFAKDVASNLRQLPLLVALRAQALNQNYLIQTLIAQYNICPTTYPRNVISEASTNGSDYNPNSPQLLSPYSPADSYCRNQEEPFVHIDEIQNTA